MAVPKTTETTRDGSVQARQVIKKDVGMGLLVYGSTCLTCTLPSLHLHVVSVVFGSAIPTLNIFSKCFIYLCTFSCTVVH